MKYGFVIWSILTLWKGCYLLLARALPPVVFMAQLYSTSMAISLYVPSWIQYDLWNEALFETLVKI